MGNAASKEFKATALSEGDLRQDASRSISPSLVFPETMEAKSKGKKWIAVGSDVVLWSTKQVGVIKSHSLIRDAKDGHVATVITEKMGMSSVTNLVCRSAPTFDGQEPVTVEELKRAGIVEDAVLYAFSKIETVRKMTTGTSTYGVVAGKADGSVRELVFEELYTAEKLSTLGFLALFREGNATVAKAHIQGLSMSPVVEAAAGVDLLAIVLMGYALAGDSSAGALAGAGVI